MQIYGGKSVFKIRLFSVQAFHKEQKGSLNAIGVKLLFFTTEVHEELADS